MAVGTSCGGRQRSKKQLDQRPQLTVTTLDGLNMKVRDHEGRSHDVPLTQPLALEYDRVWTSYRSRVATRNGRLSSPQ
ncbi:hypothetical protein [Acaryochloris sp. CCMEE 5410]|uniref:hypothetical protein n=1 Tax=Acaryochloris sp. CCMEE 5410 TaxID=310037 RepID=UPI0021D246D1|nr:hypothetical protein [Acaryochloris sp. CCMEE 5410]